MADPYWRCGPSADGVSIPMSAAFPGYLTSEPSMLTSRPPWASHDPLSNSSDFMQKDNLVSRPGAYGSDDIVGISVRSESGFSGYTGGASLNGYPSTLGDPYLLGRRDVTLGNGPGIPDLIIERPDSLKKVDGFPVGNRQSNVLFVDGLPSDCSRREVSHLFRPFFGFREVRVVHKEPRHTEDKAMVLCFVEFLDAKCALTALEALQGYKFDNKKLDSPALRIHCAHFPFRLPSDGDEQQLAVPREHVDRGDSSLVQICGSTFQQTVNVEKVVERDTGTQSQGFDDVKRKNSGSSKPWNKKPKNSSQRIERPEVKKKSCDRCGKNHPGECWSKIGACFRCGETGHKKWNCPKKDNSGVNNENPQECQ
ncbi:uncharacterized protein LOC112501308 isoform X2 [Cynara cardunculus var. scolymus]|uniref:uncharacterized protein LOC112501308 isoform X2 n=1 Tax=Cynara cardunculus var. scolymus TaxID=59895 RepID=UPI000D62CD1C|nr:uncharacterized protein LOC112501308 isoform X2 [Cynara cardunculus var. scolymus]